MRFYETREFLRLFDVKAVDPKPNSLPWALLRGKAYVIYGKTDTGKTRLSLNIAAKGSMGELPSFPCTDDEQGQPYATLYIGDGLDEFADIAHVFEEYGGDKKNIYFWDPAHLGELQLGAVDTDSWVKQLGETLDAMREANIVVRLIIVDTVSGATINEFDGEHDACVNLVKGLKRVAREHMATVLGIHTSTQRHGPDEGASA